MRFSTVALAVALSSYFVSSVAGLSWSFPSLSSSKKALAGKAAAGWVKEVETDEQLASVQAGLGLSETDISTIFRSKNVLTSLGKRQGPADCFKLASTRLRFRCSDYGEDGDMHEGERVDMAISMTICELATARHNAPPLECTAFQVSDRADFDYRRSSLVQDEITDAKEVQAATRGACVEALSHSPQFWSSYSGYLRDVPQLCFAFRRWADIDTAKSIYANATLEKIAFLRLLSERERMESELRAAMQGSIQRMDNLLVGLHHWTTNLEDLSRKVQNNVDAGLHTVVQRALSMMDQRHDTMVQIGEVLLHETTRNMDLAYQDYASRLVTLTHGVETQLATHTSTIFDALQKREVEAVALADRAYSRWEAVITEFDYLHRTISSLSSTATAVGSQFSLQTSTALAALTGFQDQQAQLASSLGVMGTSMEQIVERAQAGGDLLAENVDRLVGSLGEGGVIGELIEDRVGEMLKSLQREMVVITREAQAEARLTDKDKGETSWIGRSVWAATFWLAQSSTIANFVGLTSLNDILTKLTTASNVSASLRVTYMVLKTLWMILDFLCSMFSASMLFLLPLCLPACLRRSHRKSTGPGSKDSSNTRPGSSPQSSSHPAFAHAYHAYPPPPYSWSTHPDAEDLRMQSVQPAVQDLHRLSYASTKHCYPRSGRARLHQEISPGRFSRIPDRLMGPLA